MSRDDMRAGDGDRKAVEAQLRTALDEGRLDLAEYDERLQKTYAAKTYADLDGLLDDLPGTIPVQQSQVQPHAAAAGPEQAAAAPSAGRGVAGWILPYAGLFLVCVVIWGITSLTSQEFLYFWPVWMLIPLIFGVVGQFTGRGAGGRNRDRRRDNR
jgi:hypothetical protein